MKTLKATLAVLMGLALLPAMAAAAPSYINYQGRLVDANGNPLSGSYSITFNIYGVSSGGSAVWTEVQPAVTVDNGIFSAKLGSVTALPPSVFASDTRYLGVTIGSDAEMSPRVQLLSVPYAIYAASAASVGSAGQTVDISTGVNVTGNVNASGNVIAAKFVGDGSLLTGISAGGSSIILPIVSTHIASGGITTLNISDLAITDAKINDMAASKLTGSYPALNGSAITSLTGANVSGNITGNAANITGSLAASQVASGALGSAVIASSIAVGAVQDASIVGMSGSKVSGNITGNAANITGSLAASQVASGALGSSVIASSVAVGAVQDASIVGMAAAKLSGALPAIDGSALTGVVASNVSAAGVQ
ncbi:MAG: hypothetical protein M0011_14405, partial [Elusimicrobia bacterium]|nr:hypothetical protein [Elusimicrobiota bacterium]